MCKIISNRIRHHSIQLALVLFLMSGPLTQEAHPTGHNEDSSWSVLTNNLTKMHAAMSLVKSTGDTDADFAALMLPHHQAAIEMAKSELLYGKDPQMRRLAQEIITDQQSEMQLMQLWLKQHPAHQQ